MSKIDDLKYILENHFLPDKLHDAIQKYLIELERDP